MTSRYTDTAASEEVRAGLGLQRLLGGTQPVDGPLDQTITRQLFLAVSVLVCLAILPGVALCLWAAHQFDTFALDRDRTLLLRSIEEEIADVSEDQASVTIWDDAIRFTKAGDQAWMDDNIGIWISKFYDHDLIYTLDAQDAPILAVVEGETRAPVAFEEVRPTLEPLLDDLRDQVAEGEAPEGVVERDILMIRDHPAVVSLRPIVPSTSAMAFVPDETYVHISVVYLDGPRLDRLGRRNLVTGARFVATPPDSPVHGAISLIGARSGLLGYVVWTPSAPGWALIRAIAPGMVLSVLALMGLIVWLLRRLRRAVSQIHASKAQVQHLAFHDTLTGLPNRALFDDRLDQALAAVRRGETRIALHYIDLDRFKHVNDTLGHPAGDELIRQVAQRLNAITRRSDTVARLGGDEFVILQSSLRNWSASKRLAERTLEAMRKPFDIDTDKAFVGASIGIALAPDSATDRHELMRKADIALYQAKSEGKDRYCVFEDSFDEMVRLKRSVEQDLREALHGTPGLALAYQPFFSADGRTICGAEALFRWNHPRHGSLSPSALIAIAEERGLAAELGEWILREACDTAKALDLPILSINISPLQFQDPHFPDLIFAVLNETGLSPKRLQIEIKESFLLEGGDPLGLVLERLRRAGVRVALDDFGSGYSSFRYLDRFRVDGIKIDRAFVQNLGEDKGTDAMVQVMFDLARAFKIDVVAEGVEDQGQWDRLKQIGMANLQGFLFARPQPREELTRFLRGREIAARPGQGAAAIG